MKQARLINKILSLLTSLLMLVNTSGPVFAQEATPSAETAMEPTPDPNLESTPEATPEPTPQPTPEPTIDNIASVSAATQSLTDTGQNVQIASEAAAMISGPAIAIADSLIETNVTNDNSQLNAQITTDEVPLPTPTTNSSINPPHATENTASISATTSATANTGNNIIIAANDASLITANAVAIANAINLVNLALDNAEVYIYISNISPDSDSILIFPRPELFSAATATSGGNTSLTLLNQAEFSSTVSAIAITGNNTATADDLNQIITGDAYALSLQLNCINALIQGSSYYFVAINHPLVKFITPPHQSSLEIVQTASQTILTTGGLSALLSSNPSEIMTSHQAVVTNQVSAYANTGDNIITGSTTSVTTGISIAIANSLQFINTKIVQSRIFISIVNFLGSWTGSAHFNYPDATISLTADSNNVQAIVSNLGYDLAHQPKIIINIAGQQSTFTLEDLAPNQTQSVTLPISAPASLTITADVTIADPEINLENNHASATITVTNQNQSSNQANTTNNHGNPQLSISATNNTVAPMNPGDTVTFEIIIKNTGDGDAPDTILDHQIYDQFGSLIGNITLPLGNLTSHQGGTLRFGITIPFNNQWGEGQFFTQSQALGSVNSNIATTTFAINRHFGFIRPVQAAESNPPPILGDTSTISPPQTDSLLFAYLLVFLISLIYLIKNAKIANPIGILLHTVALISFLLSVYEIASLTHLIQPIAVIDDNYQLLAGKLRQFL